MVGMLFIFAIYYDTIYNLLFYSHSTTNAVSGRKITKNILFWAQKWTNTHFFSIKMLFFSHFCLLIHNFSLYLRQFSKLNHFIINLKTTKL